MRTALKGLGAKHPDAYQEFVRTLQPGHVARPTKSKGVSKKKVAVEDTIIVQSAATTTMAQNPPSSHGDRTPAAVRALVDVLPMSDVRVHDWFHSESTEGASDHDSDDSGSSIDDEPVAGVRSLLALLKTYGRKTGYRS